MASTRRPTVLLAALLTGALAVTGCGLLTKKPTGTPTAAPTTQAAAASTPSADASTSSDTAALSDPCTLITDNDVSVSVGKPVAKHFPATNGPILSCEWTLDPAYLIVRVTLARTTKEAFDSGQKLDSSAKPVNGVGDAAYLGGDYDLRVLEGTYLLTIKYSETAKPDLQLTVEKAIANKVIPKLP